MENIAVMTYVLQLTQAMALKQLLPANAKRKRVQLYNSSAVGTGSTVYVGAATGQKGNAGGTLTRGALDNTNGWPLGEEVVQSPEGYYKLRANVLELFTKAAIYGRAYTADAQVTIIEETN